MEHFAVTNLLTDYLLPTVQKMTIIRALLAFYLLPNNDTRTSVQVFQYLMSKCRKYETNLFSINVYVDF